VRFCFFRGNNDGDVVTIYQTEGAEDGESLDVGKSKFDETQNDDEDIETVPAVLKVRVETESQHLQHRLSREDRCEHLDIT